MTLTLFTTGEKYGIQSYKKGLELGVITQEQYESSAVNLVKKKM